ncbi:hypothetical protein TVAG_165090 [Trichomonas vaginalis G3]|uniref:Uncharacterized protein n=1 Tax=Trichomonas vaginalis (strain ATCC PRA-98 / G3) TaxID=412133 RepID=A2DUJ0_TRIV3|nr:hypothetical protein TVAGG3_0663260 [Trichomonas vaginalis G3]EAY15881.1 hypothetical protein TVAG_165090 [Trichomonas vaginalis G3]KAI5506660.1 hypothetical protein TVAGG3_0663260 [Trichomonas vaginalis G3]|eukprot:XP_001328104.1 hypothetical protein [Trichomonas vaginalis G3]
MNLEKIDAGLHPELKRPPDFDFDSLDHLKSRYNFLKNYANLDTNKDIRNQSRILYETILSNVLKTRNIYLLYLASHSDLSTLSENTQLDILKCINKKQEDISNNFSSSFSQCLLLLIKNFHEEPEVFAQIVYSYFSKDISDQLYFGYSTFPAIFGYFSSQEFTFKASRFILELFSIDEDFILLESVLVPFLLSAHSFLEDLWCQFHKLCTMTLGKFDEKRCYNILIESLQNSISLLTNSHIFVIQQLIIRFPHKSSDILISQFLYKSFNMVFTCGSVILPNGAKKFTNSCFQNILSTREHEIQQKIFDILSGNSIFTDNLPKQPTTFLFKRYPFIFSFEDIKLIYDILIDDNNYKSTIQSMSSEISNFHENKNVFEVDMFFSYNQKKKLNNNVVFSRSWNSIVKESQRKNICPIDFFNDLKKNQQLPLLCMSFEFEKFAYQEIVEKLEQELINLTFLIDSAVENEMYKSYSVCLERLYDICLSWNSFTVVESFDLIKGEFQICDLINIVKSSALIVFSDIDNISLFPFHLLCSILDKYKILIDGPILNLQNEFVQHIYSSRLTYRQQISSYPSGLMIVLRYAHNLSNALDESLGRRLVAIIEFTKTIILVAESTDNELVNDFFNFGLFAIKNRSLLGSFIVLDKILNSGFTFTDQYMAELNYWNIFCSKLSITYSKIFDFQEKLMKILFV